MPNRRFASTKTSPTASVRPQEVAHFDALASDWWNPQGRSAMLHRINPTRLSYIRQAIDRHWQGDSRTYQPLVGRAVLDVGCGAGLLAEPLARMGAQVTAIDAAAEVISVAQAHAAGQGLAIDYHVGDVVDFPRTAAPRYDLITALEVIEHVADPADFIERLAQRLSQGGLMILSTPNRTIASKLLLVEAAERLGAIPRGTHDWERFLRPEELQTLIEKAGLVVKDCTALSFSPTRGFQLGGSNALNYIVSIAWK